MVFKLLIIVLIIGFFVKAINGNEILLQIARLKHGMLSDLSYYQTCVASGEFEYAAFETNSRTYYQTLTDIESIVTVCARLIKETRNISTDRFDSALNDSRRLKDEGFEQIRLYFYTLYKKSAAFRSQLATMGGNVSAVDENDLSCNRTSTDYDGCLNGILSKLQSTKDELTAIGTEACTLFNNPYRDSDYAQTVYSGNTEAAIKTVNSQLTEYAITQAEIVVYFNNKTRSSYDSSITDYQQWSQPYETQLSVNMYRKLNTLKTIVSAVKAGATHTNDSAVAAALNSLNTRITHDYISLYNFITGVLNAITAFDYVGQLTREREKVDAAKTQSQCETTPSSLGGFFVCVQAMYASFIAASDSISSQYIALVYLDFPKDVPWWRIMDFVPRFINSTLRLVPANSKLQQGLKCFRDYHIVYKTAEEIEVQYKSCSSYFYVL